MNGAAWLVTCLGCGWESNGFDPIALADRLEAHLDVCEPKSPAPDGPDSW